MALKPILFPKIVKPIQFFWHRFALSALIVISFSIMIMDKLDVSAFNQLKTSAIDIAGSVLTVVSQPVNSLHAGWQKIRELNNFSDKLIHLTEQNNRLKHWQHIAGALAAENSALRSLNNFVPMPGITSIAGRVVANSGGPFVRSILINIGSQKGAKIGHAVMSNAGFIGVIVEIGYKYSRVLLITDLNSQIPVTIQNTRDPGILTGNNSRWPQLFFVPHESTISSGDVVVTSGRGGILPANLPVGVIIKTDKSDIRMQPFVDWSRLEYIRVLNYQYNGTVVMKR
jgi:rod shape-determining protein MreC